MKSSTAAKAPQRRGKEKKEVEEDLKYIAYFYRPTLVETIWKGELQEGDVAEEVQKKAK